MYRTVKRKNYDINHFSVTRTTKETSGEIWQDME